ncbi:zinc finger CCCH-type antiviral protein 1-like isoform X1 [Lagenorhynchus albirostris]|uniref:zinc finger CCCH-type antiviral protein 1-like isoform X1 n=1 Tax=Lagenorhynchus albirostris TaxID=27610 RepID=UPI0028EC92A4|nr:zinc finger CCCH-type antiviral protein 1-like isoform X1 [Lagenorhynchus albirostris]
MAEPTVCSFLTKVLCAHGGRMFLQDLRGHVELSEARLRDVLRQAGPDRFLLQEVEVREDPWDAEAEVAAGEGCAGGGGGGPSAWRVVAVSSARLCARYQRGECQACDQLHLCRRHMMGKCPNRDCWSTCTLSHDIHIPVNIQVLKNQGLFGLNEAQLRILLLQNDPCLLPEVCLLYNKGEALYGYCNLKDKCNKFHVCKSFVRGECRLPKCKRSHQLIHATSLQLLQDQGLNIPSVVNFQIIATYKHMKLHKMLENKDNSASSAEHSQGLEKQGVHVARAAEAGPLVSGPAASAKKPCAGLSLLWPLPLRSTGSGRAGSAAMAYGPSRSVACGIFPDRGMNPCPQHQQADSQPLRH